MTEVLVPCPGRLVPMAEVPDPGEVTVVSPIAGKVLKVHPHAFVVLGAGGVGILVHLGINTVRLDGKGFEVLVTQGANVEAGDPMVRWDPSTITGDDISTLVPIVAMDRPKGSVPQPEGGEPAKVGDVLFTVAIS